ncbi:MAG TPA: hypothetical protein VFO39_14825 [Candidatus Sulfotelmatobacter sp.]|nr:hypothetical protein [Candidatus Sulfotelmatobacter sp.]
MSDKVHKTYPTSNARILAKSIDSGMKRSPTASSDDAVNEIENFREFVGLTRLILNGAQIMKTFANTDQTCGINKPSKSPLTGTMRSINDVKAASQPSIVFVCPQSS